MKPTSWWGNSEIEFHAVEPALPILIIPISGANVKVVTVGSIYETYCSDAAFGFAEVATHPLLSDFDAFSGCGVWRWWRRLVDARKRKVRFIISVSAAAQVQNYPPPVQALNPHIARNCHFQV